MRRRDVLRGMLVAAVSTQVPITRRIEVDVTDVNQLAADDVVADLVMAFDDVIDSARYAASAIRRLGVSVYDLGGVLRRSGDVATDARSALVQVDSPTERLALELALFGRAKQ